MLKFKNKDEVKQAFKNYSDSHEIAEMLNSLSESSSPNEAYWLKEAAIHIKGMYGDFRSAIHLITEKSESETTKSCESHQVDSMRISRRAKNILLAEGIKTVEDLSQRSCSSLMRLPNCGLSTAQEIEKAMKELGFKLVGEFNNETED